MGWTVMILGRAIDVSMLIGAVVVVLMMVHITVDVVAKYIFQLPMPGTITVVSNYYMIIVAFLPLALTERRNGHISVEVLTTHFPGRVQRILNIVIMAFSACVFAALGWQALIEAGRAYSVGSFEIEQGQKLLIWPARYLLPVGCGLITITLLVKIWIALVRGPRQSLSEPFL